MAGLLVSITLAVRPSNAQYAGNFQTNIISGVTSNWTGDYYVGGGGFADALLIQSAGILGDANGHLGLGTQSSNNTALVTDTGSVWSNSGTLCVGQGGAGNSLTIRNGAAVRDNNGSIGDQSGSSNNVVVVTDTGSVWTNTASLLVGNYGASNRLTIINGAEVFSADGIIGELSSSSNNTVVVSGTGSVWSNTSAVWVGANGSDGLGGSGNSLIISNGGRLATDRNSSYNLMGLGSSSNRVVITGSGSVWSGIYNLYVGDNGSGRGNSFVVRDGGATVGGIVYLWGTSNLFMVADAGSVWSNGTLFEAGTANSVVISNGGAVISTGDVEGSNISVVVTGPGSIWNSGGSFAVSGPGSTSLVISNGGLVLTDWGAIEGDSSVSNSGARVVDGGIWQSSNLTVLNRLTVAGGSVFSTNLHVGDYPIGCNGTLQLDSGSVCVTNASHNAVLDVRGKLVINGGTLVADTLVITNPCAVFLHTGGTLVYSNLVLNPNLFRITSVSPQAEGTEVTWIMGPGATNALQATSGDAFGNYQTNGFTDICVVTNNAFLGIVMGCLV